MDVAGRGVYRGQVTKLTNLAREYLASSDSKVTELNVNKFEEIEEELTAYVERLTAACDGLKLLNAELRPTIKPDDANKEWETILEYEDKAASILARLKKRVQRLHDFQNHLNNLDCDTPSNRIKITSAKLPKLALRTFGGDFKEWLPFWEVFRTAVHERTDISGADKFNYLINHLTGKAAASIAGFTPTNANYDSAISMLLEEYGDKDKLVDYTMQQLMSLPHVTVRNDVSNLRKLYNDVATHTRALTALGVAASQYAIMLRAIILKCLPRDLVVEFYRLNHERENDSKQQTEEIIVDATGTASTINSHDSICVGSKQLHDILSFLKREVTSLERSGQAYTKRTQNSAQFHSKVYGTAAGLFTSTSELPLCLFCKSAKHLTENCNSHHSVIERKTMLKEDGRCFKCTRKGHSAKLCKVKCIKCKQCNGSHATAVCDPNFLSTLKKSSGFNNNQREGLTAEKSETKKVATSTASHTSATLYSSTFQNSSQIFLQTASVIVSSPSIVNNRGIVTRLILDGGSQRSYIKESVAKSAKLKVEDTIRIQIIPFGCSGNSQKETLNTVKVKLKSVHDEQGIIITAVVVPDICPNILPVPCAKSISFPSILLADDPSFGESEAEIGLLLGADVYWTVVRDTFKRIDSNLVAIQTIFGWTLHGPTLGAGNDTLVLSNICLQTRNEFDEVSNDDINADIERFWNLESIGISSPTKANSVLNTNNYIRKSGNRYEASLLWKNPDCTVDSNYKGALIRFEKLVQKLSTNNYKLKEYDTIMWEEFILPGIAEKCDENEKNIQRIFYMPHRPVYREDKETTKTRIVFDASAHSGNHLSLNELLTPGPNLLPEILAVLLNFRLGKIGIVADVEKAFLQINLSTEDRDVHRFIWFKDRLCNECNLPPIAVYRMKRVTFGVACSPFLLCATLQKHFEKEFGTYPETCQILKKSFYMDDLVVSIDNKNKASTFYSETLKIMQNASMNIRKWNSNDKSFGQVLTDKSKQVDKQKVLGLIWHCLSDEIAVDLEKLCSEIPVNITKRNLLQFLARIYDPLGVLGPYTVRLKRLFQESWRQKLDWDAPFPHGMVTDWNKCIKDFTSLQKVTLSRCIFNSTKRSSQQLHIFADASPYAYGVVAYVRSENEIGTIFVSYICSKNRVAPLRTDRSNSKLLTLPRMELTAALIAARLQKYITENLSVDFNATYLWSDSKITLYWITSNKFRQVPYIDNRIQEILELTAKNDWKHCPGEENPADLLTRGINVKALLNSKIWFDGPSWLVKNEDEWPLEEVKIEDPNLSACFISPVNHEQILQEPIFNMENFSSYRKLIRTTAYVHRFISILKGTRPSSLSLIAPELKLAEAYWIRHTQSIFYKDEILALSTSKMLSKHSGILSLNPVIDHNGILRVRTRLSESDFSYDEIFPVILPKNSYLTVLLVSYMHDVTLHGGVNSVLTRLREKFWIIKARQIVKTVIRRCGICKRLKAKGAVQPFAPLPKERLSASRPFETTGVDFAGPLYVRSSSESSGTRKVYFMLLTCAAIRAVHLELVLDLTAESCISALKRFFARRGIPKLIMSDNARNFKRAALELRQLKTIIYSEELQNFITNEGICWQFIVERAAWWGGFWERLIRIIKDTLKLAIGRSTLTIEQLQTFLAEAEYLVNARPLTYISDDPMELSPLTPAHFLLGSFPAILSPAPIENSDKNLRLKWKDRLRVTNSFFKRFRTEYVQQLRSAHCNRQQFSYELKEGDIVMVHDSSAPRLFWKLAKVTRTFPGRDSKIRACEVQFHNGAILRRSIQHLYPLEIRSEAAGGGC